MLVVYYFIILKHLMFITWKNNNYDFFIFITYFIILYLKK